MATDAVHDDTSKESHCVQWWPLPSAFNLWSPWTFNFDVHASQETAHQEHQQSQEHGEEQLNQTMDSS